MQTLSNQSVSSFHLLPTGVKSFWIHIMLATNRCRSNHLDSLQCIFNQHFAFTCLLNEHALYLLIAWHSYLVAITIVMQTIVLCLMSPMHSSLGATCNQVYMLKTTECLRLSHTNYEAVEASMVLLPTNYICQQNQITLCH